MCVYLDSDHVVDSIKSTLILAKGHWNMSGEVSWGGKKTLIHNFLDTTQLFEMPTTGLGYLMGKRRNYIFLFKKNERKDRQHETCARECNGFILSAYSEKLTVTSKTEGSQTLMTEYKKISTSGKKKIQRFKILVFKSSVSSSYVLLSHFWPVTCRLPAASVQMLHATEQSRVERMTGGHWRTASLSLYPVHLPPPLFALREK